MLKIIMYKTPVCPYCVKAKSLLQQKGVAGHIEEIDITQDPEALAKMLQATNGRRTVPQIFINDKYIGGCDDLYELNDKGELDSLLL